MGVYDRQVATAQRLIKKYGQIVIWRSREDSPGVDPDETWKKGAVNDVDFSVNMAFFPRDRLNRESQRYAYRQDVKTTSVQGLMGAVSGFVPKIKDVVIRNGVELSILNIDEINVNGEPILYEIDFGGL